MTRSALQTASFLDDRVLTPNSEGRWIGFRELADLLRDAPEPRPLHFIFHAGHVGSTLISRLLDELGGVLGLREPAPLRVLAEAFDDLGAGHALLSETQAHALLALCCQLWSRGYPDTEAVVVKATSSAGRIAPALLRSRPDARAILMNLRPEPYLATLMAGRNSHIDLRGQGAERYRRLGRLGVSVPTPLYAMSPGEIAALTWLAETLTHKHVEIEHGDRVRLIDFDAFLAAPAPTLQAISSHLGIERPDRAFAAAAESPALRRYSKAPDQPYSPALRQEIVTESRRRNGEEIRKGLAWLDNAARQSPSAASVVSA